MRYRLRSKLILKWVMAHPKRGTPYSVRGLAEEIGLSHHSKVGHLLSGHQSECDEELAEKIAEAVGVHINILFVRKTSPDQNDSSTENDHTP